MTTLSTHRPSHPTRPLLAALTQALSPGRPVGSTPPMPLPFTFRDLQPPYKVEGLRQRALPLPGTPRSPRLSEPWLPGQPTAQHSVARLQPRAHPG